MATTAQLYHLQEIDTARELAKRRLLELQALVGETDELKLARGLVKDAETALHHWQSGQKDAELESQAIQARIRGAQERLMSGTIRNPKELESLQASIDAMTRQHNQVEDKGVEALLHVEEESAKLRNHRSRLASLQESWARNQRELIQEGKQLQVEYGRLKEERSRLAASLAGDVLSQYEQLRKRRSGTAVARIRNEMCDACHVRIPTGVVSAARHDGTSFVHCPSCGRILYTG